jgi:TIR domain
VKRIVFISHASADKAIADRVCDYLEKHGVACWIAPRDVTPGKNYGAAIVDAIDECRVCVLLLSAQSNKSRQVVREIERAASSDSVILPFRIEDVQPSRDIAFYVSSAHWLDATKHPVEDQFDELLAAIQGWQKAESGADQSPPLAPPLPTTTAPTQTSVPSSATTKRFPIWLVIAIAAGGLLGAGSLLFVKFSRNPQPVVSPIASPENPSPAESVAAATPEPTASAPEPSPTPMETPTPMPTAPPNRLKPGERLRPGATPESVPEPITPQKASPPSRLLSPAPPLNLPVTPAGFKSPVVREIAASSQITNEFRPNYAFDGNPATAWVPKGRAVEQSLFVHFKSPTMVRSISILSTKIHTLRVVLGDGTNQLFTLKDDPKKQRFELTKPVSADSAKFEIVSVFPGKNKKAGIAEISFNEAEEAGY